MSEYRHIVWESTDGARKNIDRHLDRVRFEGLLRLAEQLCLNETPSYDVRESTIDDESSVVATLGTLGVRYAIEIAKGEEYNFAAESGSSDMVPGHPMWRPELFSGPLDRDLMAKATTFGDALIEEAYNVLGCDADEWVKEFALAENDKDQIAVLDKLHERLYNITEDSRDMEEGGTTSGYYYHPVRLSPKLIGTYPDHSLSPTCLGVAIIGAGFLKKAGAEFLHGGVMQTALQSEHVQTLTILREMDQMCATLGVTIPENIATRLDDKYEEVRSALLADPGTHSALFVRLSSGRWYQLDPGLNMSGRTFTLTGQEDPNDHDKKFDEIYTELQNFEDIAPGLELSGNFNYLNFQLFWPEYIEGLKEFDESAFLDALTESDESATEMIREFVVHKWLFDVTEDSDVNVVVKNVFLERMIDKEGGLLVDALARDVIESFVLNDMEEAEWKDWYVNDPRFRSKAIDDVKRLPALIGVRLALLFSGNKIVMSDFHTQLELGLPATRIGLSTLHNIGLHLAEDISPEHWLSQWPSHIVPPDMLHRMYQSPSQQQIVRNNVSLLAHPRALLYTHTYGIIVESHTDNIRDSAGIDQTTEENDVEDRV